MKQGILITAYKNLNHLKRIISHFDDSYSFFIHIDKKSKISDSEITELKNCDKPVFVSRQYETNWGGVNHLKASLLLLQEAVKNRDIEYFHLISGHDFPIKTSDYFKEFLTQNNGKCFMEYFTMPSKVWIDGGMDRLELYNLHDVIDAKGKFKSYIGRFNKLQKIFSFKRKLNFNGLDLYGGGTWWTLSKDCCLFVLDFIEKNPSFLSKFKYSFCAEEIFYQTVILNSKFKDSVVNDSLRYILWEHKHGNIPGNLDESDLTALKNSAQLFARRFEYPVSEKLLNSLEGIQNNVNQ